jgi:hypothetical protein
VQDVFELQVCDLLSLGYVRLHRAMKMETDECRMTAQSQ